MPVCPTPDGFPWVCSLYKPRRPPFLSILLATRCVESGESTSLVRSSSSPYHWPKGGACAHPSCAIHVCWTSLKLCTPSLLPSALLRGFSIVHLRHPRERFLPFGVRPEPYDPNSRCGFNLDVNHLDCCERSTIKIMNGPYNPDMWKYSTEW